MIHHRVIDTAILYPHPFPPTRFSLRRLCQVHLGLFIQQDTTAQGHDSVEDALACLELIKKKLGMKKEN
jgi:RNA exonuclease 1